MLAFISPSPLVNITSEIAFLIEIFLPISIAVTLRDLDPTICNRLVTEVEALPFFLMPQASHSLLPSDFEGYKRTRCLPVLLVRVRVTEDKWNGRYHIGLLLT